jgi:hypothetical protein
VADKDYLAKIKQKNYPAGPVPAIAYKVAKSHPELVDILQDKIPQILERAKNIYPTVGTYIGDDYLLERVILDAIADVSGCAIRFEFPHIDAILSPKVIEPAQTDGESA